MTPKHCRTCGFTDCPGATTGDCPRWPARDQAGDLDRFTTDDLDRMHQRLADTGTILYQRVMQLIEVQRQIPVFDCEAYAENREAVDVLMAAGAQNHELLVSVGQELRRREGSRV